MKFRLNIIVIVVIAFLFRYITEIHAQEENLQQEYPQDAQGDGQDTLFHTGILGNILKAKTPNNGRTHTLGSLTLTNADYTRGKFDGVPEELKNIAVSFNIAAAFQVWKSKGVLHYTTLTIGTQQGLSNNNFDTEQLKWWYESNYYSGLVFVFSNNLSTSMHYLAATSPNIGTIGNEIDFAISYFKKSSLGWWEPTIELTVPLGNVEGLLLQIGCNPSFILFKGRSCPLAISFPLRLGAGFNGYYTGNDDFTNYLSAGILGQISPHTIPETYGKWNVFIGSDLVIRDDALAEAGAAFDNGGNFLILGRLGFSFLY